MIVSLFYIAWGDKHIDSVYLLQDHVSVLVDLSSLLMKKIKQSHHQWCNVNLYIVSELQA